MEWGGAQAIAAPEVPSDPEGERSRHTGDATPRQPARSRLVLRLGLLRWAVGGYCGIVGALTFVTPHQFVGPAYRLLRPYLPWWGLLCLLAAAALISVALLSPRRRLTLAAHILAAVPVLLLAFSAGAAGGLTGLIVYTVLGVGTAVAPMLGPSEHEAFESGPVATGDLFAVVVGIGAILNGALMLLAPDQFGSSIFNPVRPYLWAFGTSFLVGGLGVVWTHTHPATPYPISWASHLLLGVGLSIFGPPVAWPNRAFTTIAYYNGYGALVAALPWLRPRLRRTDPGSLRTRLALAFGLAVSVPLVTTMALVTNQVEQSARAEAFSRTRVLAETLSLGISDYIDLHRAAVAALAAQPNLLAADPQTQHAILRAFADTYPDALTFVLFGADGRTLARGDDVPIMTPSAVRSPLFDDVRQSGAADVRVVVSPSLGQPVVALGLPLHDANGRFAGVAAVVLESTRLANVARRAATEPGGQVWVVDQRGRVIAAAGDPSPPAGGDASEQPAVAGLLAREAPASLSYETAAGERLAGTAIVPGLGWGVVVDRPAALALSGAQTGRDLAFAIFLVVIATAAILGWIAAARLAAPLEGLTRAVDALAFGSTPTTLPTSGVTEVSRLAAVFGDLRDRLRARTAERERAERRLRLLADASSHLAASLDYETTLERVAWLAVPALADWCLVDVLEDDGEIRRVEVAHADSSRAGDAEILRGYPPDRRATDGIAQVLRTGVPELIRDVEDRRQAVTTRDERHQAIVLSLGARSLMRVPLLARGRTLGVISLISVDPHRRYGAADLALAEELGRRCAVAVDNARLYAESQQAIRARDEFLSIASHELRTPLTGIKGYAQILQRAHLRGQLDEERLGRSLATIDDAADRLTALVDDLLDVSRIRTGHLPLRLTTVDLVATLREVTDRYRDHLGEQHSLELELPDAEVFVGVDVDRLEQVVTNLLSNAVKYSPAGGAVRLSLVGGEGGALVQVTDSGIGLPTDSLEAIFQPFGRAANATRRSLPGMGLGLYICRTLVERHGGRIWATSGGENRGTTFGLWLPRATSIPAVERTHA
jgi:signal transduction histidine kinase